MVVRDLSYSESRPPRVSSSQGSAQLPLAPVADRFIAFILDFLILSPVVSFFVAGILRNLKTVLILNSDSEEAVVIWGLFVASLVGISALLQGLFLFIWQATPGQRFMQLQVIPYPQSFNDESRLSLGQSLLRPFGWWLGTFLGGVPFLEILGHPLRRAFHERVSDTVVISLKQEPVDVPLAVETRYISSTMWLFFGFLFVTGIVLMGKTYREAVHQGLSPRKIVSETQCPQISEETYQGMKRLDMALALYFADETTADCLGGEAQHAVWSSQGEEKALGQLALSVISETETEATAYQDKVCGESEKSEACAILGYLRSSEETKGNLLRKAGLGLISSRLLLMKDSMELANYASAVGLIKDLESETPLQNYLNKKLVKAAWTLNAKAATGSTRQPASNEEVEILREFKKRFDIE